MNSIQSILSFKPPQKELNTLIVVGAQFGDEGKGKVVNLLADNADIVVRSQGGANAGHTILLHGREFKLHLIPSGILSPNCQNYIGGGVVLDPAAFLSEIDEVQKQQIEVVNRLWISTFTHIILPYHKLLDQLQEEAKGENKIGTTGRGIGPSYADKANRIGIRVGDFIDPTKFRRILERNIAQVNKLITALYKAPELDAQQMWEEYSKIAVRIQPFVKENLEIALNQAISQGKTIIFEGAQATFLDNTFGTVPNVTSAPTLSSGMAAGAAVGPTQIKTTLAVAKAYTTRVGNGPLPTEVPEKERFLDHKKGRETGTTTGRNRRVGWFDAPLVKSAVLFNGASQLALTKLDILDKLKSIKICVAYEHKGQRYDYVPDATVDLSDVKPIYEEMEGWESPTTEIRRFEDLPEKAKSYCKRISELCGAKISIVSVGPDRDETIFIS